MKYMEGYEPYATTIQQKYIDAVREHGSGRAAAKALDKNESSIRKSLASLRKHAAKQGFAPDYDQVRPAPPGQKIRGVSTYYDKDGKPTQQWVKTALDNEQFEFVLSEIETAVKDRVEPLSVDAAVLKQSSIKEYIPYAATVYPIGDPHIGMYAWKEECGEDFDTDIAERELVKVFQRLAQLAPPTEEAVILNLGDFFHADNSANRTVRSGFSLDTDTRWANVLRVGIRIMFRIINSALQRHKKVTVRNCIGNHDDHSAIALTYALAECYRLAENVTIETSPSMFWYWKFGKNLVGATHGDKTKLPDLPLVMAHDVPKWWGETLHRYWYTGHVHHKQVMEEGGVIAESFRTLAPRDSYHAGQKYRAGRDMNAIVLDAEHGETDRIRTDIRWVK